MPGPASRGNAGPRRAWEAGVEQELEWWRRYLASGGLDQPEELAFRLAAETELQLHIARHLPKARDRWSVLDCAAGPATTLGKLHRGTRLEITAVDALAARYDALLDELGLEPPVRSIECEVERLSERFEPDSFDLVYMRFALDHCYDPIAALRQMVRAARPGCCVLIEHYRDASQTEYRGLRQWDLIPQEDNLLIQNVDRRISVAQEVTGVEIDLGVSSTRLTLLLRKRPLSDRKGGT